MEVTPIFSVGVGKTQELDLLSVARQLFADNKEILQPGEHGLTTTLRRYNSLQDCATLHNQEAVNTLKSTIKNNAIKFYEELGFDVEQLEFDVTNLWLNEMCSSSAHPIHTHYGFQLSGCFYVDVPQSSNVIKFYTPLKGLERGNNPEKQLNQYNAQFFLSRVNEGDMLFWESLLSHEVPALEFQGVRRSIAYDVKISRKINLPQPKEEYRMNLQDYIAIYNIQDINLCKQIIQSFEEDKWYKHNYNDPVTRENTTYSDDLDISYQSEDITNKLHTFFEQCAKEYITTVAPQSFALQNLTCIRFNRYNVGTNMKMHHDHIHTIFDGERKGVPILTLLGLLNDDFEGGDFLMFDGKKVKLSAGDVIVFPSNFLYRHGVTTVTKGIRYSCVSWGY